MATAGGFFSKRYLDSIAYLVGLILFFLPFVELKYDGASLGGFKMEFPSMKATGMDLIKSSTSENAKIDSPLLAEKQQEGNNIRLFTSLAGIFGLTALVLSILSIRNRALLSSLAGILAVISMAALFLHFRSLFSDTNDSDFFRNLGVSFGFTFWFYLSLLSFLLGAALSFSQRRITAHDEKIPKGAPQLDLENPGDQSDFPKSASASEIG